MKVIEIKRKNGDIYKCLVDDNDFEYLNRFKWHYKNINGINYANTWLSHNKGILMHKLLLTNPDKLVDHIDNNGLNNQRNNLRYCTKSQNAVNTLKSRGKSKYKGVSQAQSHGIYYNSWYAYAWHNKKRHFLGQFKTEDEAAIAYNIKMIELHGNFAKLNQII